MFYLSIAFILNGLSFYNKVNQRLIKIQIFLVFWIFELYTTDLLSIREACELTFK